VGEDYGVWRHQQTAVRGVGLDPIVKTIHDGADIERAVIEGWVQTLCSGQGGQH
jgi:hypothetical protein